MSLERIFTPSQIVPFDNGSVSCNFEIYRPKSKDSLGPVAIGPGYGSTAEAMQLVGHELARAGFTAYCPDIVVGREPRKLGVLPDIDRVKRDAILWTILFALHEEVKDKVDVIAHSKGAIEVVMTAVRYPMYFRNILLVAPGGIHPGRGIGATILNLLKGDPKDHIDKEELASRLGGQVADLIKRNNEIGHNYRRSTIRKVLENWTSSTVTIDRYFKQLRAKGIRIVIVAQKDDAFFPPEFYNPAEIRVKVDNFIEIPGIHGQMKFVPESCRAVIDILKELASSENPGVSI